MSEVERAEVPVALVFGDTESSEHLRSALKEIGADIVYDTPVAVLDVAKIDASGAHVVLVNLDAAVGERLDDVDATLQEDRYRVIFDDPDISCALDGWARARWLRHLAAKLRNDDDVDPPRPADAAAPAGPDHATNEWLHAALDVLGETPPAAAPAASDAPLTEPATPLEPFAVEAVSAPAPAPAAGLGWSALELTVPETLEPAAPPPAASAPATDFDAAPAAVDTVAEASSGSSDGDTDLDADAAAETDADAGSDTDADIEASLAAALAADRDADDENFEAPAGDVDFSGLEAELNAAFGTDTLASLDAAATEPEAESPTNVEPPAADATPAQPAASATDDDGTLAFDEVADDLSLTPPDASAAEPPAAEPVPPAVPEPHPDLSLLDADAPVAAPPPAAAPESRDFDIDYLSLVDLEPPAPPAAAAWEAVEHRLDPEAVHESPAPAPQAVEPPPAPAAAHAESADAPLAWEDDLVLPARETVAADTGPIPHASEFGVNVQTAEDYLAPEAPTAAATEAEPMSVDVVRPEAYLAPDAPPVDPDHEVVTPERVSLTDAVAPEVEGEASRSVTTAAPAAIRRIVVLAASVGGPDAVRSFLSVLPERFPATFVLAQHLNADFVGLMVQQFARSCALPVRVAETGEHVFGGEVLVVPHGRELHLPSSGEISLAPAAAGPTAEPSIEATLQMAAAYGEGAIGIVFSGLANDAVAGARAIVAAGGAVWAQDAASCVVSTMPDAVRSAGLAAFTGSPRELAERLVATFANEVQA